jgi:hypothetical protein
MTSIRHRNAWMWLAIAAMAVVSLARIEAGANTTVYTNPVLAFLAGHQNSATGMSMTGAPRIGNLGSARHAARGFLRAAAPGSWIAVLPVLFIGLVAPLSLVSARSLLSLGRTPAFPQLPEKFQRPPPALL